MQKWHCIASLDLFPLVPLWLCKSFSVLLIFYQNLSRKKIGVNHITISPQNGEKLKKWMISLSDFMFNEQNSECSSCNIKTAAHVVWQWIMNLLWKIISPQNVLWIHFIFIFNFSMFDSCARPGGILWTHCTYLSFSKGNFANAQ